MPGPAIAIIGAGFSGANLASQLLAQKFPVAKIYLIDKTGRFGPGLAYSSSQVGHLLNVRAGRLSADPANPEDFADWLRFTARAQSPADAFAPRSTYGSYLETHLRRASRAAGPGALELARDAAVSCRPEGGGYKISLSSGDEVWADAVILALGNLPAAPPAPFDTLPLDEDRALIEPWDAQALSRIRPSGDVLLVGTGLTMIDAVLTLTAAPREGKIFVLSRRGLTPRPHADAQAPLGLAPLSLPEKLSHALRVLRQETTAAAARGEPWQYVVERLRVDTSGYWRSLSLEGQQRFLRHLRPWWDAHRHRAPQHVERWIRALQSAGMLEVIAGKLVSAGPSGVGLRVQYRRRGEHELSEVDVARVVNCTGSCTNIRKSRDPLIAQLLADGLVRAHATGMGFDINDIGALIGAEGSARPNFFALGPLTQGALWESTAVPEIRAQAAGLALRLRRLGHSSVRQAKSSAQTRRPSAGVARAAPEGITP